MDRRLHLINFIRKCAVTTTLFLAPLHFLKLGFGGLAIGLIVSCFAVAPLVFSFPTGWINDRFSMKRVILIALLAQSSLYLLLGSVRHPAAMAGVFLLVGIANNALDVSINSLYYKGVSEGSPNRKYGTFIFWTAAGSTVGLFVGGIVTAF